MRSTLPTGVTFDLRPWPYDASTTQLVVLDLAATPDADDIEHCVAAATRLGAMRVRTSALFPAAADAFLQSGFVEIDRLALLERDLRTFDPTSYFTATATRPIRRRDLSSAADVDRAAFDTPWALDERALGDVRLATPHSRARLIRETGTRNVAGFAISGRADTTGYLQRLAVTPAAQRLGVASALVCDALTWMQRRAHRALVNTGVENTPALALYDRFGFAQRDEHLLITERLL